MWERRKKPGQRLLRICCFLLLASTACTRAIRHGMEAATQTDPAPDGMEAATQTKTKTAIGSTLVEATFEDPDWFVFLEQAGAAPVQQLPKQQFQGPTSCTTSLAWGMKPDWKRACKPVPNGSTKARTAT